MKLRLRVDLEDGGEPMGVGFREDTYGSPTYNIAGRGGLPYSDAVRAIEGLLTCTHATAYAVLSALDQLDAIESNVNDVRPGVDARF